MRLFIDGYNLLHATDLFGAGEQAGTLEGSRAALLSFLVSRLTARERRQATIVFDAAGAPPGLPDRYTVEGLAVRFARGYADADSLLEEMIEQCPGPKSLTVISSDHRVQRAARSRGAAYTDSDAWWREIARRGQPDDASIAKEPPESVGDADYWAKQFADAELFEEIERQEAELIKKPPATEATPPGKQKRRGKRQRPNKPKQEFGEGILDPFPPGYAEDLAKELDKQSPDIPSEGPSDNRPPKR